MEIREFDDSRREEVRSLIRRVFSEIGIPPPSEPGGITEMDLDRIPDRYSGRGRFWIAVHGDEVIGTVAILEQSEKPDVAKLKRMVVHPDWQGSGLAQSLFDHALIFVRQNGYRKIFLSTRKTMVRAHAFYEKNGFVKVAEPENEYHYEKVL